MEAEAVIQNVSAKFSATIFCNVCRTKRVFSAPSWLHRLDGLGLSPLVRFWFRESDGRTYNRVIFVRTLIVLLHEVTQLATAEVAALLALQISNEALQKRN